MARVFTMGARHPRESEGPGILQSVVFGFSLLRE